VPGLTRGKEKDACTAAPARVVCCVSYHEWIESVNSSGQTVDLAAWLLDDEADAQAAGPLGSAPYVIPAGTIIEPGGPNIPPLFGRSIYIQDHTGGIPVLLYRGEFPPLQEGDWPTVRGWLNDYHGERRVWVTRPEDLQRGGSGQPLRP